MLGETCLALALYFEARGEPELGQIAVGQVIMRRVESPRWPDTVCGVITQGGEKPGCHFSFYCDGKSDEPHDKAAFRKAKLLAKAMLQGGSRSITDADHYHATDAAPIWCPEENRRMVIGNHVFCKVGWR